MDVQAKFSVSEDPMQIPEENMLRFLLYKVDALTQLVFYNRCLIAGMDDPSEINKACQKANRLITEQCLKMTDQANAMNEFSETARGG